MTPAVVVIDDWADNIIFQEFREEECTVCKDEFVPNMSEVWMAACGHSLCQECYADPRGEQWRRMCAACTQPSMRYLQLYRPVESDYEVETDDSSDGEGDLQPVGFAGIVGVLNLNGGGGDEAAEQIDIHIMTPPKTPEQGDDDEHFSEDKENSEVEMDGDGGTLPSASSAEPGSRSQPGDAEGVEGGRWTRIAVTMITQVCRNGSPRLASRRRGAAARASSSTGGG